MQRSIGSSSVNYYSLGVPTLLLLRPILSRAWECKYFQKLKCVTQSIESYQWQSYDFHFRFRWGFQPGRQGHQLRHQVRALGDAEERPPGPRLAHPAREETAQSAAARQLQTIPHHGDQPQGKLGNFVYRYFFAVLRIMNVEFRLSSFFCC